MDKKKVCMGNGCGGSPDKKGIWVLVFSSNLVFVTYLIVFGKHPYKSNFKESLFGLVDPGSGP